MVRTRRVYSGATLMRVLYPVALCMIFVAINVNLSHPPIKRSPKVLYGLFHSYDSELSGKITLFLMGFLIVTTSMGVFCYRMKFYKAIKVYIIANSVALLVVYSFFHVHNVMKARSVPVSLPTAVFLVLQFGGLGILCVHWKCHRKLHQFYLVMLAALTAIFLLNNLPDWSVWLAIISISVWDIIAVLTPCGPLKMLVETANRRGDDNFPAILYNSSSYADTPDTTRSNSTLLTDIPHPSYSSVLQSDSLLTTPLTPRRQTEVREVEGSIRLGMGDFVFYSLMLGNTVQTSSLSTVVACFVSNLVGLTITLPVVTLSQTAIPALPFPLAIAALFYFSSHIALNPFIDSYTVKLILF
ncbi:CRE-HOP-1 protein [Caenorhabditis remanei]|uniref:Presenilin n=1 Tax=Caenorhabditis remanei TaxID=31234 RepID=E3MGI1_CAERE|nr:CRE-HOP-1 protein [Caenorhabditis remanei]